MHSVTEGRAHSALLAVVRRVVVLEVVLHAPVPHMVSTQLTGFEDKALLEFQVSHGIGDRSKHQLAPLTAAVPPVARVELFSRLLLLLLTCLAAAALLVSAGGGRCGGFVGALAVAAA